MRALIVDDHPVVRRGLRRVLELEWDDAHVTEADTLAQALRAFDESRPDIVVLDANLPDAHGTEALARMRRVSGEVPILMLSRSREATHAQRLLQMGAAGCVSKDRTGEELIPAITRVMDRGRWLPPELADRLLATRPDGEPAHLPHALLTPQELRVMVLMGAGLKPPQVAERMQLSLKTVANYRMRVLAKMGWQSHAELVRYCQQHQLAEAG